MSQIEEFGEMERVGWSDGSRAAAYVELFSSASDQAIPSLIDAVGARGSLRVLDLCCGQGNVTRALVDAGCDVVGADFSKAMLKIAEKHVPGATFVEADAQELPFEDEEFDAVVSNLGICHVPNQPLALAELRRVLRPNGRIAITNWCGPDKSPAFETLYGAVNSHGHPDVSVPNGPDFHQFANLDIAKQLFADAKFSDVEMKMIDCYWDLDRPEDLYEIYEQGTVRAASLLGNQPASNMAAIKSNMSAVVRERFAHGDKWRAPVPAALVSANASP